MARTKTVFFCQNCGSESAKWLGKCPSCNEWNTYVEEVVSATTHALSASASQRPINIKSLPRENEVNRISTGIVELDRVLGGGIVSGSLVLVGGEPGIGKSTLMLQMAVNLKCRILYASGEESIEQIKMRSDRIGSVTEDFFLLPDTHLSGLLAEINTMIPDIVIIDSIQTLYSDRIESSMGSIAQVKECAGELMKLAKRKNIPVFLIGHVNKEGAIAGPKVLEHMVDTVLQFEGDRHLYYRILRTTKNRFGSTSELGIFEMNANGLREVTNPSEVLMSPGEDDLSGIALGTTLEGNRPLMMETQALVSPSGYGNPQRSSTGYDGRRLNMILAVMEKRLGVKLSSQDVFLNIAGGLKVQDTALDLAICTSVFSSYEEVPVPRSICFCGEIGLAGEVRPVSRFELRINEAEKLGFKEIYISRHNIKGKDLRGFRINVKLYTKLSDVLKSIF